MCFEAIAVNLTMERGRIEDSSSLWCESPSYFNSRTSYATSRLIIFVLRVSHFGSASILGDSNGRMSQPASEFGPEGDFLTMGGKREGWRSPIKDCIVSKGPHSLSLSLILWNLPIPMIKLEYSKEPLGNQHFLVSVFWLNEQCQGVLRCHKTGNGK